MNIISHLISSQLLSCLDDRDWLYKTLCMELMTSCNAMCVFADEVTEHMIAKIRRAQELEIPIRFYDADCNEMNYDTLAINKRIGPGYRKMIADVHGDTCGNGLCPYSGAPCGEQDVASAPEQKAAENAKTHERLASLGRTDLLAKYHGGGLNEPI